MIKLPIGMFVYLVAIISLGGIRREDVAWAKQIMKALYE